MPVAEKNDVNLSPLFHYGDKFEIKERNGKTSTVYVRLVGDSELNRARIFAIRKSSELRTKLHDKNSDEYIAFVPEKDSIDPDVLINLILTLSIQAFTREALNQIPPDLPAEPDSNAELEEQEKYQKAVDEYPLLRNQKIQDYVSKRITQETDRLHTLSEETLYTHYTRLIISDLCEQEMLKKYREMCLYFGTYRDKKFTQRFFSSFEEFDNIPTEIKEQLLAAYNSLDITTDELKK